MGRRKLALIVLLTYPFHRVVLRWFYRRMLRRTEELERAVFPHLFKSEQDGLDLNVSTWADAGKALTKATRSPAKKKETILDFYLQDWPSRDAKEEFVKNKAADTICSRCHHRGLTGRVSRDFNTLTERMIVTTCDACRDRRVMRMSREEYEHGRALELWARNLERESQEHDRGFCRECDEYRIAMEYAEAGHLTLTEARAVGFGR